MRIIKATNIDPEQFDKIRDIVSTHSKLLDVLSCEEIEKEKRLSPEIITQDEYTHDIIFELSESTYLVYDTN